MKLFSFLVAVFMYMGSYGQSLSSLIAEADRLEAIPDEKAAFSKFKEVLKIQPTNLYALVKSSELCCRIGGREKGNLKLRDDYFNTAVIYAKTAIRLNPESDEANTAMAIAVGKSIMYKSGKEKISAVKDLKTYADKALKLNPRNFKAWHVLGKWNYEVSDLSGFERAGAKIMYGGLPPATLKNAIYSYEKAKALNNTFSLNYLELAKAYKRNGEKAKAMPLLTYMITLKNQTEDDPRIKTEAIALLNSWK